MPPWTPSRPPQDVGPASRFLGAISPVSPPPSPGPLPRGEPRWFALAVAGCPLLPATSGPPRPCAPVVERPADGQHLWQLLPIHFRRRSRARAEPRQHVLPARPGVVLVGAIWALLLPVLARAPLLARLGSWLVKRCSACSSPCSPVFLSLFVARLVCTVHWQIKVVSTSTHRQPELCLHQLASTSGPRGGEPLEAGAGQQPACVSRGGWPSGASRGGRLTVTGRWSRRSSAPGPLLACRGEQ